MKTIYRAALCSLLLMATAQAAFLLPQPSNFSTRDHWFSLGTGAQGSSGGQVTPYAVASLQFYDHVYLSLQQGMVFNGLSNSKVQGTPLQGYSGGLYHFLGDLGLYAGGHAEQKAFFTSAPYAFANTSYQVYGIYRWRMEGKMAVKVRTDGRVNVAESSYLLGYGGLKQVRFDVNPFAVGTGTIHQLVLGVQLFGGNMDKDRAQLCLEGAMELPFAAYTSGGRQWNISAAVSVPLCGDDQENLKEKATHADR